MLKSVQDEQPMRDLLASALFVYEDRPHALKELRTTYRIHHAAFHFITPIAIHQNRQSPTKNASFFCSNFAPLSLNSSDESEFITFY